MNSFTTNDCNNFKEIQISINDSGVIHYGGNQYWFPNKLHQLSGCGPIAAANITAYLAFTFPNKYINLYPYITINKNGFIKHMVEIRKYVIPGIHGLTSVEQFADNVLDFAKTKGVLLTPHILNDNNASMQEAINFIRSALIKKIPVAILVLTHPVKEFHEYVWHWMTITDLKFDTKDNVPYITVSTYGKREIINLHLLWNHRNLNKDIIRLAYFI